MNPSHVVECAGYELCRKGMLSLVEQLSQLLNSGSSALLDTDERLTALNKGEQFSVLLFVLL
jgi:hypothetical protein